MKDELILFAVVRGGKGLMVYSEDDKPGNM